MELERLKFTLPGNDLRGTMRQDLRIMSAETVCSSTDACTSQQPVPGVECTIGGRPHWLYCSSNTSCDFLDHRGRCRFALMRLQVAYSVTHPTLAALHDRLNLDPLQRLLKGELIDVAVPYQEDHSLTKAWHDIDQFVQARAFLR
ncbi:hypothetical protein CYMTET_18796 [Cymbomonas tetramitiformis]|uniref:Uncharacterized protein n=1 Tax=Cymbomonas tetramitiformis TaxID=36881 RepID=A0AAE0G7E2_9CHLO|nr:hypothetical protein CYMTET_18796 [Cymbomonas tetramitiformis]